MQLGALIHGLDLQTDNPARAQATVITSITEDSRTVTPGALFIARPGTRTDGARFIDAAVSAGAAAVLLPSGSPPASTGSAVAIIAGNVPRVAAQIAERFHANPTRSLKLVGITGTNGKTTTAHCVHKLFNAAGKRCGLIGTVQIDDGRSLRDAVMTTPPACELSAAFRTMLDAGCAAAAMEVSSHSLHQHRTTALDYDAAVFTNLTGDHLDYHGTMEAYADAKAMLFELLKPEAIAIVNADDPWHARMIRATRARVWRCSMTPSAPAECRVEGGPPGCAGTPARFTGPWGELAFNLSMVGRHNLINCLQAIAAAHACGVTPSELQRFAPLMTAPPGRLERVDPPPGVQTPDFAVFVDYAHSDDALANVLRAARPLVTRPGARLRVVFGCGGDRDRTKRPRMARVACELADTVFITSDNPRTERPEAIIEEVLAGVPPARRHEVEADPDRAAAIHRAVSDCRPGDVLVIAGKGHETYQLLPDGKGGIRRINFDDRVVASQALGTTPVHGTSV